MHTTEIFRRTLSAELVVVVVFVSKRHKYWDRDLSEMLTALCKEKGSFHQIMSGCEKIMHSLQSDVGEIFFDFYDGSLFRRLHGRHMKEFDPLSKITIFLKFLTDGFIELDGHNGDRSARPLVFMILNYACEMRFIASETLITSFVPGTHDTNSFDSFLEPIVTYLLSLEKGIDITCYDGVVRKLRPFVIIVTGDWPAISKLRGYCYHSATLPCRFCHKKSTHNKSLKSRYLPPIGNKTEMNQATIGPTSAVMK